jgi:hypothetical protein
MGNTLETPPCNNKRMICIRIYNRRDDMSQGQVPKATFISISVAHNYTFFFIVYTSKSPIAPPTLTFFNISEAHIDPLSFTLLNISVSHMAYLHNSVSWTHT